MKNWYTILFTYYLQIILEFCQIIICSFILQYSSHSNKTPNILMTHFLMIKVCMILICLNLIRSGKRDIHPVGYWFPTLQLIYRVQGLFPSFFITYLIGIGEEHITKRNIDPCPMAFLWWDLTLFSAIKKIFFFGGGIFLIAPGKPPHPVYWTLAPYWDNS